MLASRASELPSLVRRHAISTLALLTLLATGCGGSVDFNVGDGGTSGDALSDATSDSTTDSGVDSTPDAPASCPSAMPNSNAPCADEGLQCQYPVGCPTPATAQCSSGHWQVAIPDCTQPGPACPSSLPAANSPCGMLGLVCGYGDDPRPSCRPTATCTNTGWQLAVTGCPPPPTTSCPGTAAAASGQGCNAEGAFCSYPSYVVCGCSACGGGPCSSTATWHCDGPPANAECPPTLPNLGVACDAAGLMCTYGSCSAGNIAGRKCDGGVWIDVGQACPL